MTVCPPAGLSARSPIDRPLPYEWPVGTSHHRVAYSTDLPADGRMIGELPPPVQRWAVALPTDSSSSVELELLSVPTDEPEPVELIDRARGWVAAGGSSTQTVTFQGAVLVWGVGRAAVIAPPARIPPLEAVLCEVAFYEKELLDAERQLAVFWPELEADAGPAFDFDDRVERHRPRLALRYAQLLGLRARVSRMLPSVLTPHVYPPTLASQVSERLRERLRLRHRVEVLQDQLEVFERIYDACGQRASDHQQSRTGHKLEMVIIVMLAAQLILALFEILTRAGS